MGECPQLVVGMKSCFDHSEAEASEKEWSAREWFVVKHAEIQMTQDHVLVPRVKMGVEALEQIAGPHGLDDAPLTRPDHPLVRYARDFSAHFDVIAERASVIYHLRELAKASALAKFLMEGPVELDDSWFGAVPEPTAPSCSRIPQLWNERRKSQVSLVDGRIEDLDRGIPTSTRGVYGGVQMGLDRFPLQEIVVAPSRISRADLAVVPKPAGFAPSRAFVQGMALGMPQGVDLALEAFNLSAPVRVDQQAQGPQACFPLGDAFWCALDGGHEPAAGLLKELFNPCLSDRRDEGAEFVPPEGARPYLESLAKLLAEERSLRQRRVEHFLSEGFQQAAAGSLFPAGWASCAELAGQQDPEVGELRRQPLERAPKLERLLRTAEPAFDKRTEDGLRFRIYRAGVYEVRTTQAHDGVEAIGAVYTRGPPLRGRAGAPAAASAGRGDEEEGARIVKMVEYIERAPGRAAEPLATSRSAVALTACRTFVVLETCSGARVVLERNSEGSVLLVEDPPDLEARCLQAKVASSTACHPSGRRLGELKQHLASEEEALRAAGAGTSPLLWWLPLRAFHGQAAR